MSFLNINKCKIITQSGAYCNNPAIASDSVCGKYCAEHTKRRETQSVGVPIKYVIKAETLIKEPLEPDELQYITIDKISSDQDKLVRVGTIPDGSCLFHSIGYTMNNEEYVPMNKNSRTKWVKSMRQVISDSISEKDWLVSASNESKMLILQYLQYLLHDSFPSVSYDSIDKIFNSLLAQNITFEQFRKDLPDAITAQYPHIPGKDTTILLNQAIDTVFTDYKNELMSCDTWSGMIEIDLVSKLFDVNILVFSPDGDLLDDCCSRVNNNRQTILLYNHNYEHWEPIISIKNDTQELVLPPDSDLVKKIVELYC